MAIAVLTVIRHLTSKGRWAEMDTIHAYAVSSHL